MRGVALAGVAHRGAHLLQQHVAAGDFFAAQHRALELRHEQSTRSGRQLPEILPQPLDGLGARGHAAHHAFTGYPAPTYTAAGLRTR